MCSDIFRNGLAALLMIERISDGTGVDMSVDEKGGVELEKTLAKVSVRDVGNASRL